MAIPTAYQPQNVMIAFGLLTLKFIESNLVYRTENSYVIRFIESKMVKAQLVQYKTIIFMRHCGKLQLLITLRIHNIFL